MIDLTTGVGPRAANRLKDEDIIWLTTVNEDGTPQPNPVWFYWDGKMLIIYSKPGAHRLRNLSRNPKVSLNFHTNDGGDVVVLTGSASINKNPKEHDSRYLEKYRERIPKIGLTPKSFAASYSVLIQVTPTRLRGF